MARDGAGTYSKLAGSVAVTATTIASNPYNNQIDDIASALNDGVLLSGVKPFTGDQSMGTHKLTSLTAGTAATDAANVSQLQGGIISHSATVGGTVDAITATHVPAMTTWVGMTGFGGTFTATGANTSATPTFNPDGIGVKTLVKLNNLPLVAGDIIGAGHEVQWEYNGTNVVILNPARIGNTTVSMVSKAINEAKGAAVASAGTTDIWTPADGNYVHVTGTTTITSLGTAPQAGATRTVIFDGALTLTHNATSLILPGAANITTAAGDAMVVRADTTANMKVISYMKASGLPIVGGSTRTLLATLTTTSGSTQSATGLSPASYRYFEVEINGVSSTTGPFDLRIATSGNGGTNYGAVVILVTNAFAATDTASAFFELAGINIAHQGGPWARGVGVRTNTAASGTTIDANIPKNATGGTGAVDALQFSVSAGTFDAGTILVWGVL
jgi:hypothetical protein